MKAITLLSILLSIAPYVIGQLKILFVMSASGELPLKNEKTYTKTGIFLSEFYLAWKDITEAGYQIDFATPNGKVASIDQASYDKKYWKRREVLIPEAVEFVKTDAGFNKPLTLEAALAGSRDYAGMVVPGGQGLMVDLINDPLVDSLLLVFGKEGKCVGLICHAPALLTSLSYNENPFKGYRVNSVTATEELFIETFVMKGRPVNRKIGKQLKKLGYKYERVRPAKNFAVRDRHLVTSQNPFSNEAFSRLYLEALTANCNVNSNPNKEE